MSDFFHAVMESHADNVSRALHVGRTTIAVQTDLSAEYGRRVAQWSQTAVGGVRR